MLTQVPEFFQTVWEDYTIKDQTLYDTKIDVISLDVSDTCRDLALSFSQYNAYSGIGYGESNFTRGVTEQEAFEDWSITWNNEKKKILTLLKNFNILKITQNQYDGIVLFNWITGSANTVSASEGEYDLANSIKLQQWNTVANMIKRSKINKSKADIASKIIGLADYGTYRDRIWLRTQGIYKMRQQNELKALDSENLKRARFAYFAETGNFLPFTPEGIKRDIVNKYNDTLSEKRYTADGSTKTFTLTKSPSVYPVEKIKVLVNAKIIQLYFDYTVSGDTLTIKKDLVNDDIVDITIKI
tara:strand:- start:4989 stop:5888 length:900 start_codon:yes stop_codon:yes gene_type:complete